MKKFFVILLLCICFIPCIGIRYFLNTQALAPDPHRTDSVAQYERLAKRYPETKIWTDSLKAYGALRDTMLLMPSGERHHALFAQRKGASRTAVILHGWRNTSIDFLHLACFYYRHFGYNVLLPDLHAHGFSEGETIGMGWNERKDVIHWMEFAHQEFGCDSFVVHGVSMGAATAMNVAGEKLPSHFREVCFVEDCGFTSVWDEFSVRLLHDFSLSEFPLLPLASLVCKISNGWNFTEASPLEQLKKSPYPMLFIHGTADTYVPFYMVNQLYEAKPGLKELWITEGAVHNASYSMYPEEYVERIGHFLQHCR